MDATYKTYTLRVLSQVQPDMSISSTAVAYVDHVVTRLIDAIEREASRRTHAVERSTLGSEDIQVAVRLLAPDDTARHMVSEGLKATRKFKDDGRDPDHRSASRSARAGLVFPVGRILRQLKEHAVATRVSTDAGVYLTAVVEYFVADVLEFASLLTKAGGRKRIQASDVAKGIAHDLEASDMVKTIAGVAGAHHLPLFPWYDNKLSKKKSSKKTKA